MRYCVGGVYRYTADLLALEGKSPRHANSSDVRLGGVTTPLHLAAWKGKARLKDHPDQDYVGYLLRASQASGGS